jgi:cullin 3
MGASLYDKVKEFERDWLLNEVRPRVLAVSSPGLFVGNIRNGSNTNANEKRAAGERLMTALRDAWQDHILCMNMTTDVLMYLVR